MLAEYTSQLNEHRKLVKTDSTRVSSAYEATRSIAGGIGSVQSAADIQALIKKFAH